ncbi:MAG: protein translocase subunit SecD [bacterium]|nr:protein translocase subunit SecD [bacterium]
MPIPLPHRKPIKRVSPISSRLTLPLTAVLVFLAACYAHPKLWDRPADFLNARVFKKISWELPHFKKTPFRLGLDLQGGTHLVYEADVSSIVGSAGDALEGVRDVIERRVNLFGVAEPVVEVNRVGDRWRLIVELAGVQDVEEAIKQIGETPFLEFRKPRPEEETTTLLEELKSPTSAASIARTDPYFVPTELNGRFLERTEVTFDPNTSAPTVSLQFDDEGARLFENLTKEFLQKPIAVYLDGAAISVPTVQSVITGGQAIISGNFTVREARQLADRMNAGALPVPIKIVSQETVGAALGSESVAKSLKAGMVGFLLVALFMIVWYRLPGLFAALALVCYVVLVLFVFKLVPVTLTLSGIAGFILSMGIAVDANVLIFERMKEEFKKGFGFSQGITEGFGRAWPSIRDSNVSSLITAFILFWVGSGVVKGFALTLIIGIIVSLFSAIFITRSLLLIFAGTRAEGWRWLFLQSPNVQTQMSNQTQSPNVRGI